MGFGSTELIWTAIVRRINYYYLYLNLNYKALQLLSWSEKFAALVTLGRFINLQNPTI